MRNNNPDEPSICLVCGEPIESDEHVLPLLIHIAGVLDQTYAHSVHKECTSAFLYRMVADVPGGILGFLQTMLEIGDNIAQMVEDGDALVSLREDVEREDFLRRLTKGGKENKDGEEQP